MPDLGEGSLRPKGYLACKSCRSRIASRKAILSWAFRGNCGRAALFATTFEARVTLQPPTLLLMDSGAHTVQSAACASCNMTIGWKIVRAHEWPEKWKEGNMVLELDLLVEENAGSPLRKEIHTFTDDNNNTAARGLLVPTSDLAHRRSTSDLSDSRSKPLGPRNHHKSVQLLPSIQNVF